MLIWFLLGVLMCVAKSNFKITIPFSIKLILLGTIPHPIACAKLSIAMHGMVWLLGIIVKSHLAIDVSPQS